MTQYGANTPSKRGPGTDGNEGLLCILQSSSTTGISPSDCLVSYPGHSLRESYPSAEMQLVYSTASTDWASSESNSSYFIKTSISERVHASAVSF